jgi:hypothetical protein
LMNTARGTGGLQPTTRELHGIVCTYSVRLRRAELACSKLDMSGRLLWLRVSVNNKGLVVMTGHDPGMATGPADWITGQALFCTP